MNVIVVKEDRVVMIYGEGLNFDFELPSNVWSIQWNGTLGHIEFNDGTPNEELTDFSDYQYLVDAHATEKQRLADEEVQAEADRIANMTYADHRASAYPSLKDQADMQYWDSVNGTTTWVDAINAVKAEFPKP
jgi:hypothetical protein